MQAQKEKDKKIVVLIDADNTRLSKLHLVLSELSSYGHTIVKRAYGDWSKPNLQKWQNTLNELAIQPIQQFSYTTGKNSSDITLIIDAMDLLYQNRFDAFALISSDSDFTKLASRLKESEIFVFGFGEQKTPIPFRNACDDFIFIENLKSDDELRQERKDTNKQGEILRIIRQVWQKHSDDEGWINTSVLGQMAKRLYPDFDSRTYGSTKLSEIIKNLGDFLEIENTSHRQLKFRPKNKKGEKNGK